MKYYRNKPRTEAIYIKLGYTPEEFLNSIKDHTSYDEIGGLYSYDKYYFDQYTDNISYTHLQFCAIKNEYQNDSSIKLGIFYETAYDPDAVLIKRNGKWYGIMTHKFCSAMTLVGAATSNERLYYCGACGYPWRGSTDQKSDLQLAIENGTAEVVMIFTDFVYNGSMSTIESDFKEQVNQIKWGTFKLRNFAPFDKTIIDSSELTDNVIYKLMGYSFETQLGLMRKIWIEFFKNRTEVFRELYCRIIDWFDDDEIPNGGTDTRMYLVDTYYEPLRYVLEYIDYMTYSHYKGNGTGTITNNDIEHLVVKPTINVGMYCKLSYRDTYTKYAQQIKLATYLFPKHYVTERDSFKNYSPYFVDHYNETACHVEVIKNYVNPEYYQNRYCCERPFICTIKSDCLEYRSFQSAYNTIRNAINIWSHINFKEFNDLYDINEVIILANDLVNDRADELIMFGPNFKCKLMHDSCGYNIIPHRPQGVYGNAIISFDFITDESNQYYMRATNWQFMIKDTDKIIPWYFVRSSDYTDWINKINENRSTTTAYRDKPNGSNTTVYFKDSETGMIGAIEASNYFKTLFEDTSYLQNDDLDGIGEICSSILAIERDFYESLNENSESTNDFKTSNQKYINYLGEQVEQLHLMITEQEEISNEIRIQFTEILATIDNFYNGEIPIDIITIEDIENANMNKLPNNYVYKIFSTNENLPFTQPDNIDSTGPVSFLENIINSYVLPGHNYILKECCYMEEPNISDGTNKILEYSQMMSEIQSERNRIQRTNKNSILLVFNQNINGTYFEILYNEPENSEKTCESTLGFFICTNDLTTNKYEILIYPKMYEGEPLDWHRDNYYATQLYLMNCDNLSVQFINEINLCPIGYYFDGTNITITTNKNEITGKNMIGYYKMETN